MSFYSESNIQGDLYGPGSKDFRFPSRLSRAEMQKFSPELPASITGGLQSGKLRLADTIIYSIKGVDGEKTVKMFESQDMEEVGLRNLSNAKLASQQALLVSGIYVLAGVTTSAAQTPTIDEIKATSFNSITPFPELVNGEFELKANKVQLIPPTSCRMFVSDNNHLWSLGYHKLDNPRLIQPEQTIEAVFSLPGTLNIPSNLTIYLGLSGTITTP